MSLKSFFNGLARKREEKNKYNELARAIEAGDLESVQAALKNGADAGYLPGGTKSYTKTPLTLALKKNDVKIFEALLETEQGKWTSLTWHKEFRTIVKMTQTTEAIYFTPSYLYSAIEEGKPEIALLLAKGGSPERSGDVFTLSQSSFGVPEKYRHLVKTPIELARDKGMADVVAALEERLAPVFAARADQMATELEKQAAVKRAEAEKLLQEAEALSPKAAQPALPKKGKFHV